MFMTFLFVFIGVSLATTTTLSATQDTLLDPKFPTRNLGNIQFLAADNSGVGFRTSLVQFDTPSIPSGESLVSASLELTITFGTVFQRKQIDVFALAQSWTELQVTPTTRDGVNNWSAPPVLESPADFDASTISSIETSPSAALGTVLAWDVTSIVNAWQTGAPNTGFYVKTGETNGFVLLFASKDDSNAALRPRLVVESAVPLLLPSVITISSTNGPASGGNDVDLSGSNLDSITNVFFGPNEAVIAAGRSDSDITVQVPAGEGTVPIIVRTPDKKRDDTTVGSYTYDGSLFPSE